MFSGELTNEVVISIAAIIIIAAMLHFHVKGAFCTGLIFGTLLWWFLSGELPALFLLILQCEFVLFLCCGCR